MPRYSAKAQKLRGKSSGKRQFLMLYRNVKRSTAYHGLSHDGRSFLLELIDRYTGCNNGMICFGTREAVYELRCSFGSVTNAAREVDDAGLARPTEIGVWRGRKATEWRLMWLRCDKSGDLPATQWERHEPFAEFSHGSAKVQPRKRKPNLNSATVAQTPKNPMNGCDPSSPTVAHIHIYQREGDSEGIADYPELPACLDRRRAQ